MPNETYDSPDNNWHVSNKFVLTSLGFDEKENGVFSCILIDYFRKILLLNILMNCKLYENKLNIM
ncbi:hypothetical protein AO371_1017 [Moraxella catarrhalis]|nr:hypothetical protein AO371_1017 [Moraxella catarrhalis]